MIFSKNKNLAPRKWQKHLFGTKKDTWSILKGKSVWITGAGTGYGQCLAIATAAAGGQVFLTGRRESKLRQTLAEMKRLKISTEKCHLIPADITESTQIEQVAKKIISLCQTLYAC